MRTKLFNTNKRFLGLPIIDWLIVCVGLAIFAAITLATITKSSIWFDEAFGAYLIRFNFFDIAAYTAQDVHPPLFYWLLKLWSMLFGNSEFALRSMSTLFGGISIVFGYLLTNHTFGKKAARFSLIFMVLSPMLVRYGQEARMYTLVAAIALAATYALVIAMESKGKKPWIVYGILVSLGMWTHYFSAIVWVTHWIWRADVVRRSAPKGMFVKEYFSNNWVLAHIVAVGLFIPWLPVLVTQVAIVQAFGFWIPPVTVDTMINFMTNVVYYLDANKVDGWLAALFIILIVFLSVLANKTYKKMDSHRQQSYRLIIAIAFVPMIILFAMSMPPMQSYFIDRYLITSVVGIAMFIGVTLALWNRTANQKLVTVAALIIAIFLVIGVSNVWELGNYNKNTDNSSGARQIVNAIKGNSASGQPIIASTPWLFYEAVFYNSDEYHVYFIDASEYKYGSLAMLKSNDNFKIKDITSFSNSNQIVWYVCYVGDGSECSQPYPDWEAIKTVYTNDLVNGDRAYEATQYRITN